MSYTLRNFSSWDVQRYLETDFHLVVHKTLRTKTFILVQGVLNYVFLLQKLKYILDFLEVT